MRTYNDYVSEFASFAPERFVVLTTMPFWDLDASVAELRRCHAMGHRGVLWAATLDKHGLPDFPDPHWDPLYAVAQDLGMSINFHVGVGNTAEEIDQAMNREDYDPAFNAARSSMSFVGNARTLGTLLTSGVCDRFPRLNFVSVESGFGYVPFLLDALDWQWLGTGARDRYPERLLPSEYFRRQVYAMFWFETRLAGAAPQVRGQRDVRDRLPAPDEPAPRTGELLALPGRGHRRATPRSWGKR